MARTAEGLFLATPTGVPATPPVEDPSQLPIIEELKQELEPRLILLKPLAK